VNAVATGLLPAVPNAARDSWSASVVGVDDSFGAEVGDEPELPVLDFVRPMPGFPDHQEFVLVALDESAGEPDQGEDLDDVAAVFYELRSLTEPGLRFLVAVPGAFFSDYDVELDDETCEALELTDAGDALVLVVITLGSDPTANLLAPVVINSRTRRAAQVILSGTAWPVRALLA